MGKFAQVLVFLGISAGAALAHESVKVTNPVVKVRSGPGTNHPVIGHIYKNQVYVKFDAQGNWRKIWYGHNPGWVHKESITPVNVPKRRVTASLLNVRTGPGLGYDIVGTAKKNSWWAVVGSAGAWRKIYFKGHARWVHGDYLTASSGGGGSMGPVSAAGFIQLPSSGPGFYSYTYSYRQWGTPSMIYGLTSVGQSWKNKHPSWPKIGIGDISLKNGGYFPPHVSHQTGKDVDIRPVSKTGYVGPLTIYSGLYSSYRNKDLITQHIKQKMNVNIILFNDPNIYGPLWYVIYYVNHHHHMHVRIW